MSNFQKNSKDYGEPDITYQLAGCAEQRPLGIPTITMPKTEPKEKVTKAIEVS